MNCCFGKEQKSILPDKRNLQMVFRMLKYRKDLKGLKTYVEKNRAYFSDIDEESYRTAKMMLGAESYWKDIKSEKENGGMSYEDTVRKLQEKFGLTEEDAEQKMKACWKVG